MYLAAQTPEAYINRGLSMSPSNSDTRSGHIFDGKDDTNDFISQMNGFLVVINGREHRQARIVAQLPGTRIVNASPVWTSSSSNSFHNPQNGHDGIDCSPKHTSQYSPAAESLPCGMDWGFINLIRTEMDDQWKKLQTATEALNSPRLRMMNSCYQNSKGLRNSGIITIQEIVRGQIPTQLERVFAMTSVVYVISKILWWKETILESDILDGIGVWTRNIVDQTERDALDANAQRLWPKCAMHLAFASNETRGQFLAPLSNRLQVPTPFGRSISDLSPRETTPIVSLSGVSFNHSPNRFMDSFTYTPSVATSLDVNRASFDCGYHDFELHDSVPTKSLPSYTDSGFVGAEIWNPQGNLPVWTQPLSSSNSSTVPASRLISGIEENPWGVFKNYSHRQSPQNILESKPFCVLRAMFKYLDNSLCRFSGVGRTQKDHENLYYPRQEETTIPGIRGRETSAQRVGVSTCFSTANVNGQEVFVCDECGAWFLERKNLNRHMNTRPHPRKY